ncbi:hypothetical protein VTJ83DRAFT_7275 [Remersonia thermophila]|uniref:ML-like domain-containing protein n=1 Tax=Remersonia thermophila TaxID=72144 RepID=A0ABR4D419_9PEZI
MRWWSSPLALAASLAAFVAPTLAEPVLQTHSLNSCLKDSGFSASKFIVRFTPNNGTAYFDIQAVSSVSGHVKFDVLVTAYGYELLRQVVDPCDTGLVGLCPMTSGKIPLEFNLPVTGDVVSQIPSIAYNFPDIDAKARVLINLTETGESVACVEADISNGKTVDLIGVKWATAIVACLALVSSAFISGLGHQNAAAHVAANALSLFGYFQAQAMIGLTGVPLPPVVMAWTQDFQWSMGIIHLEFMQDAITWYQRATGGAPALLLDSLSQVSVQVEKRAVDVAAAGMNLARRHLAPLVPRAVAGPVAALAKRANIQTEFGSYIVYGIQRVAFKAGIESTNLFMTGLVFFCLLVVITSAAVAAWKGFCEVAVRKHWMAHDRFLEFRNGWLTILKGILFRLTLIGFPQMSILCLWEFTQKDSPALVVLAVFFLLGMTATLAWAAYKVILIARRSILMHHNPAYILFSDPQALNKWGFLYVQFRATAYYFILPTLGYLFVKAMFIAFAQHSGTVQAVGFLIVEAAALISASVLRPWMDKKTNSFNIAICAMNFINSIFLMIFTEVFNQPPLVTGVVGLVLWIANAIFALILLLMLIVSTIFVFFRENPDGRYQIMADDRTSFMKSQTHLTATTELDALAATARGDKYGKGGLDLDDDAESITSDSLRRQTDPSYGHQHLGVPSASASVATFANARSPSPASPAMPLFPADGPRSPPRYNDRPASPFGASYRPQSPYGGGGGGYGASQPPASPYGSPPGSNNNPYGGAFRAQNNSSPWQRGAGYEH